MKTGRYLVPVSVATLVVVSLLLAVSTGPATTRPEGEVLPDTASSPVLFSRVASRFGAPIRATPAPDEISSETADSSVPDAPSRPAGRVDVFRRAGDATPRSLQVITVPVPEQFGTRPVDYAVQPASRAEVISEPTGNVPAGELPGDRATTIVARMPATAAPGPLTVAQVDFTDGTDTATVSVELVISKVSRLSMRSVRGAVAVYAGQSAEVAVVIRNLGNDTETIRLDAEEMPGWRVIGPAAFQLAAGQEREVTAAVRTPPPPASGLRPIVLRASNGAVRLGQTIVNVEVLPDQVQALRSRGPVLTAGIATVAGDETGSSPVFGFELNGPISPAVTLHGRLVYASDRDDLNPAAISRVGYFADAGYLTAAGRTWTATVGRTGYAFSPIFGLNPGGLGVSADGHRGPWSFGLLAAQERYAAQSGGTQLGGRISHQAGRGTITGSVTHLEQDLVFARTLDAAGIGYTYRPSAGLTVGAEAGVRSHAGGSGGAFSMSLDARGARSQASFYAGHAPGGSAAFARATDEITGSLWRRLTPNLTFRSFGYSTKDDPTAGNTSKAVGGSVGPAVQLGQATSLTLDVSSHRSTYDGATGTTGSGELMATVGAQSTIRAVSLTGSLGAGRSTRNATLPSGGEFERSGSRLTLRGGVSTSTARGSFGIDAGLEKNSAFTGQLTSTGFVSARASGIRPFSGPRAPSFDAITWLNLYEGAPQNGPAVRIGAEFPLPSHFALAIDVERNPYRRSPNGVPTVAAIRFERSFGLPSYRRPTARGSVFEDLNGNGRRDPGESGMAGVVVRRGMASTLTTADGSYRFFDPAAPNAAPVVEVASLAGGQMAPGAAPVPGQTRWDLPVQRTGRLTVRLLPTPDTLGRSPTTPFRQLAVVASDSAGAVWVAHPDSTGVVSFDALPAGRYKLSIDFTESHERLRMLQTAAEILLTTREDLPTVELRYSFRAARVFDGGAAGSGGRRRR